jgi:tetratricopeptide (TPR) repeat protein
MTANVESKQLKTSFSPFGFGSVPIFTFALLICSSVLLVGCNEQQSNEAPTQQVSMPPEARKAELLNRLERKFENPDAHFQLAQMYHEEGNWTKAEYHYNVALGFDPAHAEAKAAMVKLFLDSGDKAKSRTYADIYMNQASSSAIQSLRLAVAFHKEQLDEYALDSYQQAFSLAPDSARVNKEMGLYYLDKDDKVLAKEYLIRSFKIDPKQPDVANELGRLGVEVTIPGQEKEGTEESPEETPQVNRDK